MSTKLFDIVKQMDKFLTSADESILLKETNGISGLTIIEAHVRKCRLEPGIIRNSDAAGSPASQINCIDIINVAVAEKNRRKGLFTDFLELLEGFDYDKYFDKCPAFHVRIDKVMNPVLDEFLPKKGYTRIKSENEAHYSYCKILPKISIVDSRFSFQVADDIEASSNRAS